MKMKKGVLRPEGRGEPSLVQGGWHPPVRPLAQGEEAVGVNPNLLIAGRPEETSLEDSVEKN